MIGYVMILLSTIALLNLHDGHTMKPVTLATLAPTSLPINFTPALVPVAIIDHMPAATMSLRPMTTSSMT